MLSVLVRFLGVFSISASFWIMLSVRKERPPLKTTLLIVTTDFSEATSASALARSSASTCACSPKDARWWTPWFSRPRQKTCAAWTKTRVTAGLSRARAKAQAKRAQNAVLWLVGAREGQSVTSLPASTRSRADMVLPSGFARFRDFMSSFSWLGAQNAGRWYSCETPHLFNIALPASLFCNAICIVWWRFVIRNPPRFVRTHSTWSTVDTVWFLSMNLSLPIRVLFFFACCFFCVLFFLRAVFLRVVFFACYFFSFSRARFRFAFHQQVSRCNHLWGIA